MTEITFVSPISPYHAHLVNQVKGEVSAQSIPCEHVIIHDTDGKGAGWARNQGLNQVKTPFVAFLDADDRIDQTWSEQTLAAFRAWGECAYVYTDHVQDWRVVEAPERPWINHTWHVITTLAPTAWWKAIGGFDETLPAFEDTDAYLRLWAHGFIGKRLAKPLFHYGDQGQRSKMHHATPVEDAAQRYFTAQYGGRTMGCCGDVTPNIPPSGDRQEGDVLAQAIYAGNRRELGRVTGRLYPRVGNGAKLWMDARDVAASPTLWREVMTQEANNVTPDFDYTSFADYAAKTEDKGAALTNVDEIAAFFMQETKPAEGYEPPPAAIRVEDAPSGERPSADAITAKASRGKRANSRQPAGRLEAAKGGAA